MKKRCTLLLVLVLTIGMITGCGNKASQEAGNLSGDKKFEEVDGLLVYIDTENSPFEDSGLKISIKKGDAGFVEFLVTDKEGKETVNYYKFDFGENEVEKYNYVSPMGMGFYFYYDLENNEMCRVEDDDHNDTTEGTKESGRWDSSAEKLNEEVEALENYFKEQYGMTIKEAVSED